MDYDLFDYQRDAAIGVLRRLGRGWQDWDEHQSLSAFALSAVTAAGKTVIATAVIEALLHGSADLDVAPDPKAAFLWVTDDPALNRQTKNKMLAASDVLAPARLIELNNSYLEPELKPGRVYFLNIQQLAKTAGFAQGGSNLRQHSGWDVIANTLRSESTDLYLVLDEAHRGMKQSADRPSIVRRIIGGQAGSNPPVPVVWGISATIDRFIEAMKDHEDVRTSYPAVTVDIDKVRASGIVKDQIDLDEPDEKGEFSTTLLRSAVQAVVDFTNRWAAYSQAENEPEVTPVLVVQVKDKPTDGDLAELVSVIEQEWPGLGSKAVVNVFGEHDDLVIGSRTVRWVPPESIQDDETIRVVLAKEAISTGWDCPRAEVLYSDRPASDATHIAQVIGRMVRQPLARRITTDDALNAVACFLPKFNRTALAKVISELTKPGEVGSASDVVVHARLFDRNPHIPAAVFPFVEDLPSWPKPDRLASPLRRARTLAKLLTDSGTGTALLPNAGELLAKTLNSRFDGLMAEHADAVDKNVHDLETYEGRVTSIGATSGEVISTKKRSVQTATRDIDRDTRRIVASVKEGTAKAYVRYLVDKAGDDADVLTIRTRVAGLILVEGAVEAVEAAATKWVQDQFSTFAVDIKNTTGATKDAFMKAKEQATTQEETGVELTVTLRAPTKQSNAPDAKDLATFPGHLYSAADGMFPAKLNDWETAVIETEKERPSFVAWYRNPSRAATSALRIGYLADNDEWGSLQVDFVIVSKRDDGTLAASIVDPHGDHLADAKAKLRGLARYAERFGDHFVRIESVAKAGDGTLRSLDLLDSNVRQAITDFEGGKVTALYESSIANDYK